MSDKPFKIFNRKLLEEKILKFDDHIYGQRVYEGSYRMSGINDRPQKNMRFLVFCKEIEVLFRNFLQNNYIYILDVYSSDQLTEIEISKITTSMDSIHFTLDQPYVDFNEFKAIDEFKFYNENLEKFLKENTDSILNSYRSNLYLDINTVRLLGDDLSCLWNIPFIDNNCLNWKFIFCDKHQINEKNLENLQLKLFQRFTLKKLKIEEVSFNLIYEFFNFEQLIFKNLYMNYQVNLFANYKILSYWDMIKPCLSYFSISVFVFSDDFFKDSNFLIINYSDAYTLKRVCFNQFFLSRHNLSSWMHDLQYPFLDYFGDIIDFYIPVNMFKVFNFNNMNFSETKLLTS